MARAAVLLLVLISLGACRTAASQAAPPIVQPGAPGQPGRVLTSADASRLPQPRITDADVTFMQRMIAHHAQAVEMTSLVKARTDDEDLKKLALRIEVSQADEIRMMQQWLRDHNQAVPDEHAHHAHGALMPGMLTSEEMAQLAAARGRAFDRLFLEFMIMHHEGALVMVRELFASPGAAQESEIHRFASDVDADQRMEIDRMAAMLAALKEKQ